jgi:hypothetical protein
VNRRCTANRSTCRHLDHATWHPSDEAPPPPDDYRPDDYRTQALEAIAALLDAYEGGGDETPAEAVARWQDETGWRW